MEPSMETDDTDTAPVSPEDAQRLLHQSADEAVRLLSGGIRQMRQNMEDFDRKFKEAQEEIRRGGQRTSGRII